MITGSKIAALSSQSFLRSNKCSGSTGNHKRGPFSELLQIRRHRIVFVGLALLASALLPIVLADALSSALLAPVSLPLVLADASPSALLALASSPLVLADAPPAALLAKAP